jgi:ABC-2 type transport system ATP-binding protein
VTCRFGDVEALSNVSLGVAPGEIHALLGPNGAGKSTLIRVLAGLTQPASGEVSVCGATPGIGGGRFSRPGIGLIPSGDRTFYLRLSGEENLVFFARLHGMRRREALARARALLERVDLANAGRVRAGLYSHGMLKRLSVARAFLAEAAVLLVDEATHDLDPDGARRVRALVAEAAASGTSVLWATQRLDEIRGFADRVTLLSRGTVRFSGSVSQLLAAVDATHYVLRLRNGNRSAATARRALERAVHGLGRIAPERGGDDEHFLLYLEPGAVLGDALGAIAGARFSLLSCREQRSGIEEAFVRLTGEPT